MSFLNITPIGGRNLVSLNGQYGENQGCSWFFKTLTKIILSLVKKQLMALKKEKRTTKNTAIKLTKKPSAVRSSNKTRNMAPTHSKPIMLPLMFRSSLFLPRWSQMLLIGGGQKRKENLQTNQR
jgi:hypothetical protein